MTDISPSLTVGHGREQASLVVMPWLVRLRWASVVALAVAAWAAAVFWRVRVPVAPLVGLLAALAATNAALTFQLRLPAPRRGVIGASLLLDVGLLTGILYLVGGPLNPFSIVYLVGITIAAVALGHRWAVGVAVLSNVGYGLTFVYNRPLEFTDPAFSSHMLPLHLSGMWVALAAASALIAHFVSRVSEALEQRERELMEARAAAARSDRLAALLALGAGAAHELATPLSTISTAAGELARSLTVRRGADARATSEYVDIIRREVDRCTNVLDQLSGRASGASAADTQIELPRLIADLKYRLGEAAAQRLDVTLPASPKTVVAPAEPLRQALIALLRNAFDASAADQPVVLRVELGATVRIEVIDRGRGMTAEDAVRAGEPFFTTKPPGAGLGLGLFLARAFADQMGGTLLWESTPGLGTSVGTGVATAMKTARILPSILVVEDDDPFRTILVGALQARGYDARGVPDAASALASATRDSPEMAVVDLRLGDHSGLDVVRGLKVIDASTMIVVLTGYGSIATALESIRLGAVHYLTKPTDADRILAAFERGLAARPRDLPTDTPSLARVEWEHLQRVLTDCGGNVSEAARELGMHRRSLQRKLSKRPVLK